MVAHKPQWATRTGHRFTDAGDVLSVDILAFTNLEAPGSGGEGDVASVTFTINGTPQTPITSRSRRRPNYNSTVCPNTGTTEMEDIWAYGFTLAAADWPNGTITIDATVVTAAGTTTNMPQLKVYNNKTSDTRPGSKVIYVSPSGSNSNNGLTTGTPVQSIQYACDLAATAGNLGGAEIRLMAGAHSWANYYFGPDTARFTSDHWWLTIRLLAGASIFRPGDTTPNGGVAWSGGGSDTLFLIPNTGAGHEDRVNLLLIADDPTQLSLTSGDLKVFTGGSTAARLHHEGIRFGHPDYDPVTKRWSVHWTTRPARLMEHIAGGGAGPGLIEATNCHAVGIDNAFHGCSWVMGCLVEDWIGITFASSTFVASALVCNTTIPHQRYDHTVAGLIDCEIDSGVTMEVVDANRLRIQQSAGSDVNPLADFGNPDESINLPDLSIYGTELIGSLQWGIIVYNGTTPQSGTLALNVVAAGTNGTGPYIEIDWPSHGYGSGFSLAGWRLKTGSKLRNDGNDPPGPYAFVDAVHPDVAQFYNAATDWMFFNVRGYDLPGTRIWAFGPGNMTRVIMFNVGDGAIGQASSTYPGTLTDCLFFYCTFGSTYSLTPSATAGINEFRACHFESFSGSITGVTVDNCSFANPAHAVGTNQRTGEYIDGDPTADPWSLAPLAEQQGAAGGANVPFDPAYVFTNAGGQPSHGAWRNVATGYQAAPPSEGGGGGGDPGAAAAVMESLRNAPPFTNAIAIVPTNGVLFEPCDALYVGTGGNILAEMASGQLFIALNVPNGSVLTGVRIVGVAATGTTCSDLVALYI